MRNNQDRLGNLNKGDQPPVQQAHTEQPLQFVTPTEFVELPSQGVFYPENHPLHNVGVIEIRHMTAKDEDTLTSVALLRKGIAIERLIENIIIDKKIRANDLLIGDKNAIIVAARISGYGQEYQAVVECPSCGASVDYSFDLTECGVVPYNAYESQGLELTDNKTLVIHLSKSKVDVEVRFLTGGDEMELTKLAAKKRKNKLPESALTDQLKKLIVSVNGVSDATYIDSFIQNMPAIDSRRLRSTYQKIVPNIDMRQNFVCSNCGHEGEVNVPFGANFFWPQ